jgi:hypothetical protein
VKAAEFDTILEERLGKIRRVLATKATEYATSEDRLHNFKAAGELQLCRPEAALVGMLSKHLVSVFDMVRALNWGQRATREQWEEKIGDSINYLVLLEALVRESESTKR